MKIYRLEPKKYGSDTPWAGIYDMANGFVVMAENEYNARRLASLECGDEGEDAWLLAEHSYCEEVTGNDEQIILRSFHAG